MVILRPKNGIRISFTDTIRTESPEPVGCPY
jgi:hypothetical protein